MNKKMIIRTAARMKIVLEIYQPDKNLIEIHY